VDTFCVKISRLPWLWHLSPSAILAGLNMPTIPLVAMQNHSSYPTLPPAGPFLTPMLQVLRPHRTVRIGAMSRFYVLPPRPELGERFAAFLQHFFPGLDWDSDMCVNLADGLGEAAACHEDVIVVYRDDLPLGEPVTRALVDGFGAEPGDEVIEIRPTGRGPELGSRRCRIAA
jgi:hypothetical protein